MGLARRIIAFVGPLLLAVVLGYAPTASAEPDTSLEGRLDAVITATIAELGVPGAIVGISVPGDIDYVKAFGTADRGAGTPMSVADHSRIGSVTKTFTGTAVLQLVDQGRISLQDPISRYVEGVPNGDVITLDQLGRMRSGLPSYTDDETFMKRLFADSPRGPDAFPFTSGQLLDVAFKHPVKFAPGADFEYSNTNTVLLGLVVEKVTGQSLADYLQQNVFDRLGLTETSYPPNGLMPEPFANGVTPSPDGRIVDATSWNPSWANAAGQIVSTYQDLKTWAAALGRGTLVNPQTQAQRVQGESIIPGVGYGFTIFDVHGWIGHNGDIPGYATVLVYLPERDATLVVLVNSDVPENHSAGVLATAVTELVTPESVYVLGASAPTQTPEPSASR